jgi:hypothetical protein
MQAVGFINGVRHEIDRQVQVAVSKQRPGGFDGGDARGLVEAVAGLFGHLIEDGVGRFPIRSPCQSLVAPDLAASRVHDGLKRHREGERKRGVVPASRAFHLSAALEILIKNSTLPMPHLKEG